MIAPLAKFIDWSVLQIAHAMLSQSVWREDANERDLKLEQAVQFLNGPNFIPAESQPAQLDFVPGASGRHFRFPHAATVRVCGKQRRSRPAIPLRGRLAGKAGDRPATWWR